MVHGEAGIWGEDDPARIANACNFGVGRHRRGRPSWHTGPSCLLLTSRARCYGVPTAFDPWSEGTACVGDGRTTPVRARRGIGGACGDGHAGKRGEGQEDMFSCFHQRHCELYACAIWKKWPIPLVVGWASRW